MLIRSTHFWETPPERFMTGGELHAAQYATSGVTPETHRASKSYVPAGIAVIRHKELTEVGAAIRAQFTFHLHQMALSNVRVGFVEFAQHVIPDSSWAPAVSSGPQNHTCCTHSTTARDSVGCDELPKANWKLQRTGTSQFTFCWYPCRTCHRIAQRLGP